MTERAQYVALFFFVHFLFSHIDTGYSRSSGLTKRIRQINGSRTKTATGTKGKAGKSGKGWHKLWVGSVKGSRERIAVDKKKERIRGKKKKECTRVHVAGTKARKNVADARKVRSR